MNINIWIAAWLFSLIASGGVYYFARKAKLTHGLSLMIAMAAFPAPLAQVFQSHSSLLYLIDVVTPFAVFSAYRNWRYSHPKLRFAAGALWAAAGLAPFVIALLFSRENPDLLFTGANLYRLLGAMALMVRCNAVRRRDPWLVVNWLNAVSWVAIVIAVAMAVKVFGGIDSNVMAVADQTFTDKLEFGSEEAFNVMGLFRGSLGIFGALAVCAYTANTRRALQSQLFSAAGAIAGLLVCLFSGSKTSMFVAVLVLAPKFFTFGARQIAITCIAALSLSVAIARLDMNEARHMLPASVVALFDSGGEKRESMDVRTTIWQECLESVTGHPAILVGVAARDAMPTVHTGVPPYWPGYFHNEYLSITMLGGMWSAFGYFFGVGLLLRLLLPRRSGSPAERFAALAIGAGLIHGFTVAHLQPSLLFASTTCVAAAIYGFGCPNKSSVTAAKGPLTFVVWRNILTRQTHPNSPEVAQPR